MDWKKLGKNLLFPPIWLVIILTVLSTVLLVTVFVKGWEQTLIAYPIYVLCFYTLSVLCLFFSVALPRRWKQLKQRLYDNPITYRYLTDRAFRTTVSLYRSLGINLLYVALQLLQWHLMRSWWFVVLAAYYTILSVMRFLMVRYVRRNPIGTSVLLEWRRARVCACILLLVNLSLSGAVLMILYQNRGFAYNGILIYIMAMYTFYATIHTIVDIVKYRKLGSPIMTTAKIVSFSAALVSMLNLETAMFAQFGSDMSPESQRIFIILTGAGVSILVVTLSILLIVQATKAIRREKNGE